MKCRMTSDSARPLKGYLLGNASASFRAKTLEKALPANTVRETPGRRVDILIAFLLVLAVWQGVTAQSTFAESDEQSRSDTRLKAVWAQTTSSGADDSEFSSVAVDVSGNVYAAGYVTGTGDFGFGNKVAIRASTTDSTNVLLVKYDKNGAAKWARTTLWGSGDSQLRSVAVDPKGDVYVVGFIEGEGIFSFGKNLTVKGTVDRTGIIAKYSSSGTAGWIATPTTPRVSQFNSVAIDSLGNIYALGDTESQTVLVKFDSSGKARWAKGIPMGFFESPVEAVSLHPCLAIDSSGNVYVAGFIMGTDSFYDFGNNVVVSGTSEWTNPVLAKYDSSGKTQWTKVVSSSSPGGASFDSVAVDASGNIYVSGDFSKGKYDFGSSVVIETSGGLITKYDPSGTALWVQEFGYSAWHVAVDSSGGVFVSGVPGTVKQMTESKYHLSPAGIVKYDPSGTLVFKSDQASNDITYFASVAVDSSKNIYGAGYTGAESCDFGDGVRAMGSNSNNAGKNALLVRYSPGKSGE